MPEYLSPGVYMEEMPDGPRPIKGVRTNTGFVGQTERGPTEPTLVTSWGEFQKLYGEVIDPKISFLPLAVRGFFENGGTRAYIARVVSDGRSPISSKDYIGELTNNKHPTGFAALEKIDEVNLLVCPDEVNSRISNYFEIRNELINQCERLRDRFAILSIEGGKENIADVTVPRDSKYGAVYYPWIRVFNPCSQKTILIPPSGHIAGIYARTDNEWGVHKAPANEEVRGIVSNNNRIEKPLEFIIGNKEQDILNPKNINVIRDFSSSGRGVCVWGARTMSSDSLWKYVNVRRLFLFIEESIYKGTQWVVFEPNGESLWASVRKAISNFLTLIWRNRALQGIKPEEAFFVRCDRTTMTKDDIDNGRLICIIGIAPVKPAEFVIFRIQQRTSEN